MAVYNCEHWLHTLVKFNAEICSVKKQMINQQSIIIERRCKSMTTVVTDIVKDVKEIFKKCVIVIYKDPLNLRNNN